MTKKQIKKLETMAQDFLQYCYEKYCLMGKRKTDLDYYEGACNMIKSFGGGWKCTYEGGTSEDDINNPANYRHKVWFPDKDTIENMNENVWKSFTRYYRGKST